MLSLGSVTQQKKRKSFFSADSRLLPYLARERNNPSSSKLAVLCPRVLVSTVRKIDPAFGD